MSVGRKQHPVLSDLRTLRFASEVRLFEWLSRYFSNHRRSLTADERSEDLGEFQSSRDLNHTTDSIQQALTTYVCLK